MIALPPSDCTLFDLEPIAGGFDLAFFYRIPRLDLEEVLEFNKTIVYEGPIFMTIDQLITLESIVEKGSFKAASESLHKTQPSLSIAIKKLEDEFGLKLFNRDQYRPTLTEQGQLFYRWAQESLKSFRELEVLAQELGNQTVEAHMHIVLDPLVNPRIVEQVFKLPASLPPVTDFLISSAALGVGMSKVLANQADFAVAPKTSSDKNIESILFEKVTLIPVVSKSLAKNTKINSAWLKINRQVVVTEDPPKKLKVEGGPKCFVNDHHLKKNFILNGWGWGRLATYEIQSELKKGTLVPLDPRLAEPYHLELHVMRSKLKPLGPVAKVIWNNFNACAVDSPGLYEMKAKNKKSRS